MEIQQPLVMRQPLIMWRRSVMVSFHDVAPFGDVAPVGDAVWWCGSQWKQGSHWWRGAIWCNVRNACILPQAIYLHVTYGEADEVKRVRCGACLATSVHVSHLLTSRLTSGLAYLTSCLTQEAEVRLSCYEARQARRVMSTLASWRSLVR